MSNDEDRRTPARPGEHVEPATDLSAFNCPHCGVLARQDWGTVYISYRNESGYRQTAFSASQCQNCDLVGIWKVTSYNESSGRVGGTLVFPEAVGGPEPHADMPPKVRKDYEEARSILRLSPRGACGLLRLATEKLVQQLQPEGGNLNDRIGKMVAAGLPVFVQQALDSLRVIGNEAVHPGEMALDDDEATASSLFQLLNFIVEEQIARGKQVDAIYNLIPRAKREGIESRDKPK